MKKMTQKIIITIVLVATFASCATIIKKESTALELSPEMGYVAGFFLDEDAPPLKSAGYLMTLINPDTKDKFGIYFTKDKNISILSLPPGTYYVKSIERSEGENKTVYFPVPTILKKDMEIIPGKIAYFGNFKFWREGVFLFAKPKGEYRLDFDLGVSEILANYPNVQTSDIIDIRE